MHKGIIKATYKTLGTCDILTKKHSMTPFQLFLIRQRTVVATLGNMYTFALDINNSYYFVASLKTTYPQDFRNLWYPGSHNSQRLQVHETRVGWPLFQLFHTLTLDVCCWYFGHYVHICIRHQQSSNHLQPWMTRSRNSLYPSRHLLDHQFFSFQWLNNS